MLKVKYQAYNLIDQYLHDSINAIKKNRFLYRSRAKGTIFGEENLSAILKTMLEIKYQSFDVSVKQEVINGAGFSDIEIDVGKVTVSIIECKLIKKNGDAGNALSKGFDQLICRYSKSLNKFIDMPPKLYLLLFFVDPDWGGIRSKIHDCLKAYCARNGYEFKILERKTTNFLRVSLIRSNEFFGSEILYLDIVICDLEDQVDLDRTNLKFYKK